MKKKITFALFHYPMLFYTDKTIIAQVEKMRLMSFDLHKGKRLLGNYQKLKGSAHSKIIPLNATSEDSLYISDSMLIIADGVGGWKELGIDSGVYSRTLCERISSRVARIDSISTKDMLKEAIVKSINQMNSEGVLGSSTFCSVYINYLLGKAFTVTMGDTLVIILRLDNSTNTFNVIFKTEEQQHSFNMPYQCGHVGDAPEEALVYSTDVVKGDVIIVASDGLWDNIDEKEIIERVNGEVNKGDINSEGIVNDLSLQAKVNSHKTECNSPFAINALRNNFDYFGGKPDDISLIIMQIKEEDDDHEDTKSIYSRVSVNSKGTCEGSEDYEC